MCHIAGDLAALLAQLRDGEQLRRALLRRVSSLENARHLSPEDLHAAGQRAVLASAGSMLENMARQLGLDVSGTVALQGLN